MGQRLLSRLVALGSTDTGVWVLVRPGDRLRENRICIVGISKEIPKDGERS